VTLEEFVTSSNFISALITSAIATAVSIQLWFLKWLVHSFDKLSLAIKEQGHQLHKWLMDHESKDQERHEDNLQKFEKINIQLAKLEP
jgi:hypothetical protein